jgi:hypothetical protein
LKLACHIIGPKGSLTSATLLFLREWIARVKGRHYSPDYTANVATAWQCRQVTEDYYLFNQITGALKKMNQFVIQKVKIWNKNQSIWLYYWYYKKEHWKTK